MKVIVYTTKTCAYCKQLMRWLEHRNQPYEAYDVTDDIEMRKELYNKTLMTTVPITQVGDKYVVGPQYGKIAELIA